MLQPRLRRVLPYALLCLGISAAAHADGQNPAPDSTGGGQIPVTILELSDSSLIAHAWSILFPDSAAPAGEYQVLMPGAGYSGANGPSADVLLLRNGTEAGRMEGSVWEALSKDAARNREPDWAGEMEGPDKQEVPLLWRSLKWNRESLLRWADWPGGLAVSAGSSLSNMQKSKPQFQRDFDLAWTQKPLGLFPIGLEMHRSQYGGGIARLGRQVADSAAGIPAENLSREFWGDAYWWWAASMGVPGLRYTVALANQPLPQYYWLEPASAAAIRGHERGRVVSQWTGKTLERKGNLSHTLDARFGILRAGLHFDADAYRIPIETVALDDLPAWFGTWGAGVIIASDIMATHIWADIPDLILKLGVPRAYPSLLHVAFLHFDIGYRNARSYNLGLSVRLRVENPIMNRPGA